IVIGSGAAGGMAAHVLTSHGLQVLLLEAGKKLPLEKEMRAIGWPYDNPYRGQLPPDQHSLTFNEYTIRNPPYGPGFEKAKHLKSYVGSSDYVKNIVVDERENPFTGTNYAWVRARCLGGKTNIWGRLALRLSDYDFKAKSHDGYGEDWPISYHDIAPYYDKVDLYLCITGVREVIVDQQPGKASGVQFLDSETMKDYTARAKLVIVAASTLESARLLLLSK